MDTAWKKQLRRQASSHHMCEENRNALLDIRTKADAIELYKKNLAWSLTEGYPDLSVIRRHFCNCEDQGIFVDRVFHGELLNAHLKYIFHNCKGIIRTGLNVSERIIPQYFLANGSELTIQAELQPLLVPMTTPVFVYGDSRATPVNSAFSLIKIHRPEE